MPLPILVINSNLGRLTVSVIWSVFRWKTHIFPTSHPLNPEFKNVPLGLHRWHFACLAIWHRANYSCKKFSTTTYRLATIHPLRTTTTDRRTDNSYHKLDCYLSTVG